MKKYIPNERVRINGYETFETGRMAAGCGRGIVQFVFVGTAYAV